jgi:hypothetical protein
MRRKVGGQQGCLPSLLLHIYRGLQAEFSILDSLSFSIVQVNSKLPNAVQRRTASPHSMDVKPLASHSPATKNLGLWYD